MVRRLLCAVDSMTRALLAWIVWPCAVALAGFALAFSAPGMTLGLPLVAIAPAAAFLLLGWPKGRGSSVNPLVLSGVAVAGAAAVGFALAWLLGRYWAFFHLGAPATGLFLLLVVAPGGFLLAGGTGLLVARSLERLGLRPVRALAVSVASMILAAAAVASAEIASTTDERSAEGIGAGDLGPFVSSLLP